MRSQSSAVECERVRSHVLRFQHEVRTLLRQGYADVESLQRLLAIEGARVAALGAVEEAGVHKNLTQSLRDI